MPYVKKPRPKLTFDERVERHLDSQKERSISENPLLPILMRGLERYLAGKPAVTKADRAVIRALDRHHVTGSARLILERAVSNWRGLPATTMKRMFPAELVKMPPDAKLDSAVKKTLRRIDEQTSKTATFEYNQPQSMVGALNERFGDLALSPSPLILEVFPQDPDGGVPCLTTGRPFVVLGWNYSGILVDNTINLRSTITGNPAAPIPVTPTRAETDRLEAALPKEFPLGRAQLQVLVTGKGESAWVDVQVYADVEPAPSISEVSPTAQYLGKAIHVKGTGFLPSSRVFWEPMDPSLNIQQITDAQYMSEKELMVTVPEHFVPYPGDYRMRIGGGNQGISGSVPVSVLPHKYHIDFVRMKCLDESDPEKTLWVNTLHDELVTTWSIVCDGQGYQKTSNEYTGFDDGDEQSYNDADRVVFPLEGASAPVKQYLVLGTQPFEWDAGDVAAWEKALGWVSDAVVDITKLYGEDWTKIGKIVDWALDGIAKIVVFFGGDADSLGTSQVHWKADELQTLTDNPLRMYEAPKLVFVNSDWKGTYELSYRVYRVDL